MISGSAWWLTSHTTSLACGEPSPGQSADAGRYSASTRPTLASPFPIVGPYATVQYGFATLNGVGGRPFFTKRAVRDPRRGGQFSSAGATNDHACDCKVPAGVGAVQSLPATPGPQYVCEPGGRNMDFSVAEDAHLTESLNKVGRQMRTELSFP
jgi:hypothetical protein